MHMNRVIGLVVLLCCELCWTIKVPIFWNESDNSEVRNEYNNKQETNKQENVQTLQQSQSIPIDYFQYTAKKPQFAVDVAVFHGVKDPEQHYKAYPINPYTGKEKPVLGIHQLLNEDRNIYQPYQKYIQKVKGPIEHASPISTDYEVFHPYKAEEPALQELYKDPVLNKIRNDLHDSKNRLQAYEQEAGRPNVADDEYLEKIEETDAKLFPLKNIPARYEVHKPERRPVYYRIPPRDNHRDHILNQRFKHPWNQYGIKIRPLHYKPLKNHLHHLRQHHALKFNDEHNEYPQLQQSENIGEPDEGYDIYEKGKQKYIQLRNNLDESINKAVQENKPVIYQKLELQPNESSAIEIDDEFVPVKNYAQVRKTETIKHVPKKAAFDDADTYEEILNAPRLREAIKSTKAQIVYSEEGYEDSAYDHAGEQKHASDHEGHGGFLKETAKSGGLYKIPSVAGGYQDGKGSEYRDDVEHLKQWENDDKDTNEDIKGEDYSEKEYDDSVDADTYDDKNIGVNNRNKREDEMTDKKTIDSSEIKLDKHNNSNAQNETNQSHEVDKRETNFEVPTINLNTTYLTKDEILKIAKHKLKPNKDNIRDKYPYYFRNAKLINENSPLRYAENLKLMPRKTGGGTEFYDSRSRIQCPEVEDDVDPIPEKLKNDNNPTEEDSEESSEDEMKQNAYKNNDTIAKYPRLSGLGDKIDCFKAKYFGENPLDSPFFKEEIIANPTPIYAPKLQIFEHLKNKHKKISQSVSENSDRASNTDIYGLLDKLRTNHSLHHESLPKLNDSLPTISPAAQKTWGVNNSQESNVYTDVLEILKSDFKHPYGRFKVPGSLISSNKDGSNKTYNFFQNKEDIQLPQKERQKRATPFVYEPYKIIRDSQYQDSKKTTTTSNISPLIRQLQTSKVVDRVSRSNRDENKSNTKNGSRTYVNIGINDRTVSNSSPTIVDISVDQRRGEPRYEIRPSNHKSEYAPVENKRAMSIEDYNIHAKTEKIGMSTIQPLSISSTFRNGRQYFTTTTETPVYDVTSFLPKSQKISASNTVRRTVTSTTQPSISQEIEKMKEVSSEDSDDVEDDEDTEETEGEDYDNVEEDEEEDDEEREIIVTTTILPTTTTTTQPIFRRKTQTSSTTEKQNNPAIADEPERLKLVTRFRNYKPSQKLESIEYTTVSPDMSRKYKLKEDNDQPKYREKKKKMSESTLVTDTKKYGDDNSDGVDTEEEKIDAMIGIKHNINDYKPSYEQGKENNERNQKSHANKSNIDSDDDDDEDVDDDESDENDDGDGIDEEDDDDDEDSEDEEDEVSYSKLSNTTPEPTKRTLVQTTESPSPTIASRGSILLKDQNKPIITRKRIEIHKELPVNNSGPHVTQFKQDIKEVEIIKEMPAPKRKPNRKERPLELYKDDNLAKDINKLDDVEVFRENLDLDKEPKHGGNYRRASKEDLKKVTLSNDNDSDAAKDVEASQSENRKRVDVDDHIPKHRRENNMQSKSDIKHTRNSGTSAKVIDLSKSTGTRMHGGNLRHTGREGKRSEKLIELDDDRDDDDSTQDDDYKSSPHSSRHDRLHGGNYRSAKLLAEKVDNDDVKVNSLAREARRSATVLLNKYVQAAPALTTTPGYIVDPSKRMYYYVDV